MNMPRPAAAALIGAASATLVFGLVFAMYAGRTAVAAASPAAPAPHTVTVRVSVSNANATVTFADPNGQSSQKVDGWFGADYAEQTVQLPAGGAVTVTATTLDADGNDRGEAEVVCGIYDGNDPATGAQLVKHKTVGVAVPTVCTWTNQQAVS